MNEEIIELTKKYIRKQEDLELGINVRLTGLRKKVLDGERELAEVTSIKASLEGALAKLEEAEDRVDIS